MKMVAADIVIILVGIAIFIFACYKSSSTPGEAGLLYVPVGLIGLVVMAIGAIIGVIMLLLHFMWK